jgi:hypothetical protein
VRSWGPANTVPGNPDVALTGTDLSFDFRNMPIDCY